MSKPTIGGSGGGGKGGGSGKAGGGRRRKKRTRKKASALLQETDSSTGKEQGNMAEKALFNPNAGSETKTKTTTTTSSSSSSFSSAFTPSAAPLSYGAGGMGGGDSSRFRGATVSHRQRLQEMHDEDIDDYDAYHGALKMTSMCDVSAWLISAEARKQAAFYRPKEPDRQRSVSVAGGTVEEAILSADAAQKMEDKEETKEKEKEKVTDFRSNLKKPKEGKVNQMDFRNIA